MIKHRSLPQDTQERLAGIPGRLSGLPGLNALWIFGSYARGEETPLSDLDLAYLAIPHSADFALLDVKLYAGLSSFLATDEISLVNLAEAAPALAFRVLQEGKLLLCRNPEAVADLVELTLARYADVRRITWGMLQVETGATMEIDRDMIESLLRLLEADLRRLREKAGLNEQDYLSGLDAQDVVMRRFQTAIETCVNLGNHLIARLRLRLAEDYATVFAILSEEGVLSRELAGGMMELARFRNLLVHLYWKVDQQQVFRRMAERIRMLERFQAEFQTFLRSR